ncbi:hypothetical protein LguiB_034129 [Lonicera macranthoides]
MGVGKKCAKPEGLGLGLVRYASFGRKRVAISNETEVDFINTTPTKRQCSENSFSSYYDKSLLEALPQDILIRVLCGVEHDDLKRLFHVSKSIREATLIAKQWHFAYSTPTKRFAFRNPVDLLDSNEFDDVEAPNAPKQCRVPRIRLSRKKMEDLSVALFASPVEEEAWPRRQLFVEMETDM